MIQEERIMIGDIPCLQILSGENPQGVIVFYHGWSSLKEFQSLRGRIFAAYGYDVLIPDAIHHGERHPIDYNIEPSYILFWETIFQNVKEAPQLLDYIRTWRPGLPLAVTGHSMGGFSALGVMTQHKEFQTAVAMNGSGWWDESERRFRAALHINKPAGFADMMESIDRLDPYTHTEALQGRSVLALNGGADPTVDNAVQQLYIEKLRRNTDIDSRLTLYPGLGHFVTTQMMGEAVDWITKII